MSAETIIRLISPDGLEYAVVIDNQRTAFEWQVHLSGKIPLGSDFASFKVRIEGGHAHDALAVEVAQRLRTHLRNRRPEE